MTIDMHEAALAAAVRWRFLCSSKKDPEVTFDFGLPFFFFFTFISPQLRAGLMQEHRPGHPQDAHFLGGLAAEVLLFKVSELL